MNFIFNFEKSDRFLGSFKYLYDTVYYTWEQSEYSKVDILIPEKQSCDLSYSAMKVRVIRRVIESKCVSPHNNLLNSQEREESIVE